MRTGKIKWFNADKGYGFIEPDDKSKDVFLHVSELAKTGLTDIKEGEKLSFELANVKGKIVAIDIKLI
jgi:CspA family cold shock protein